MLIALTFALAADPTGYAASRQAFLLDTELALRELTPALDLDDTRRTARIAALDALRDYAEAATFPHNHESQDAVPALIDSHDTLCAVAFMVTATGSEGVILAMAAENNAIRLPTDDARILAWAHAHGLTMTELATIQEPGYAFEEPEQVKTLPIVRDTPSKSDVLAGVKSVLPKVQACGKLAGHPTHMTVSFRIHKNGRAKDVALEDKTLSPVAAQCAKQALAHARFPKTTRGSDAPIKVPFRMRA